MMPFSIGHSLYSPESVWVLISHKVNCEIFLTCLTLDENIIYLHVLSFTGETRIGPVSDFILYPLYPFAPSNLFLYFKIQQNSNECRLNFLIVTFLEKPAGIPDDSAIVYSKVNISGPISPYISSEINTSLKK